MNEVHVGECVELGRSFSFTVKYFARVVTISTVIYSFQPNTRRVSPAYKVSM